MDSKRTLTGLLAAIVAVFFGFAVFAVLQNTQEEIDVAIFVAFLFFPLIAYALFSGIIAEVSGPGGWGAKFRAVADSEVTVDIDVEKLQIVEKTWLEALPDRIDALAPRASVALQFMIGQRADIPNYTTSGIEKYVKALAKVDPELTIVLVDKDKKFKASTDAITLRRLENMDNHLARFVDYMGKSDLISMKELVPLTTRSVREGETNEKALRAMLKDGVQNLVVTDEFDTPVGLVKREKIVARMMFGLTESSS